MNDFDRAVVMAKLLFTANAFFRINHNSSCLIIPGDRVGRTNLGAISIFTVVTNNWKMVKILIDMLYVQNSPMRIAPLIKSGGAFQLTDQAPSA